MSTNVTNASTNASTNVSTNGQARTALIPSTRAMPQPPSAVDSQRELDALCPEAIRRELGTGFTENVPKRGKSGPRTKIRNEYSSSAPHAAEHGDSIPDPEVRRTRTGPGIGPCSSPHSNLSTSIIEPTFLHPYDASARFQMRWRAHWEPQPTFMIQTRNLAFACNGHPSIWALGDWGHSLTSFGFRGIEVVTC
ncbi:hypothetical protein B0H14DRAFT_2633910 [Mycena olivaceomarginata]|nr:hypothetical protein B0H14DRAFT_2633910 [Mycena olivaceomarginata]